MTKPSLRPLATSRARLRISTPALTARAILTVAGTAGILALGAFAEAQTGANVLVVINGSSATSDTIGHQYAAKRDVPRENVCALQLPVAESVSRAEYGEQIEEPIWKCIAQRNAHDRILYIVLTKDVPIRISGTGGRTGTSASVDSELTLLYRRRSGQDVPIAGFVANPYFVGTADIASIKPFTHQSHDVYLVTRLDGYTLEDALALIDHASAPTADGRFILDQRASSVDPIPNRWLGAAAKRLESQGLGARVLLDETEKVVTGESRVLGYYSWGSNDDAIRVRTFDLEFLPGALAGLFASKDGRTFNEPPAAWRPGGNRQGASPFAGSSESLMADLIRAGATGVSGNIDEPYLDATIRPDILFPAYASGRNLAEAFYSAMPYLSWQTIVVGDPLCAPFPHGALSAEQTDPPIDAATELPTHFGQRLVAALRLLLSNEAAAAFSRFQSRTLRNDTAGARQALEAAIAAEPRFIPARLQLATIAERAGEQELAIAQYRTIISYSPNDPVALNNLAYGLALYHNNPKEALPFAERAIAVARRDPALLYFGVGAYDSGWQYMPKSYRPELMIPLCLDTLAWVQHLLGRNIDAASTIRQARAAGGNGPEMLWHAAVIYAANNDASHAMAELSAAVAANPSLADRDEVQKLSQQLSAVRKVAGR